LSQSFTSPHIKGKNNAILDEVDYTVNAKLAVCFGSETRGISETAVEHADICVSIPMFGMVEA
jgi:tRNA (guanosine-2'-O-)-methyltransferase